MPLDTPTSISHTLTEAPVLLPFPNIRTSGKLSVRTISVLHVINGEHFSGAERVQQLLGKGLPKENVIPHFACIKPGKFPILAGLPSETIHRCPMANRLDWKAIDAVTALARKHEFDLLHAHTPRSAMVTGIVAKRLGLPWIYHVHSPAARDSTRPWINRCNHWIERWSLRNCSKIVTVSKSLRREMLRQGWSRHKLVAIGNGVSIQTPMDPTPRLQSRRWNLGMVALFRPRKGIESLLQAMALLPENAPSMDLQVIGGFETPSYESEVRQEIEKLGLQSQVHLQGFTEDVTSTLRQLDGLVLPSLFGEGMPMVVLEAMAVGVPILATRVEGTPEVVRDKIDGILAAPGDSKSLCQALMSFTECRDRWMSMSLQAYERQRSRFTDTHMAQKMASLYRSLS